MRTERGLRAVAAGERVMFLRNDRGLGVRNGTLGTVRAIGADGEGLTVQLDGPGGAGTGRVVSFDTRDHAHLEHGYAATVHKSQAITADRAHVLATPTMDRSMAYVALSRQRERVDVTYARKDFEDLNAFAAGMARDRTKDTTLDYAAGRGGGVEGRGAAVPADTAERYRDTIYAAAHDALIDAGWTKVATTRGEAAAEVKAEEDGQRRPRQDMEGRERREPAAGPSLGDRIGAQAFRVNRGAEGEEQGARPQA